MSPGLVYVCGGSRITAFAGALAWLWRLGPLLEAPHPGAVGIGWQEEADELHRLVKAGDLAGAAIFAPRPGPPDGPLPSRSRVTGVARFGAGQRVGGQFSVLHDGNPAVRSSLGVHAVRDSGWMVLGADPDNSWGALDAFWVLPALADFIADLLDRPLVMLPALGWVRYDDVPGTVYHQIAGTDKPDAKVRRRVEKAAQLFAENDAVLNIAIPSRALVDGDETGADEVWPGAIEAIGTAIDDGTVEAVCHGNTHLDTEAWGRGEINPQEFGRIEREEADRRLAVTLEWFDRVLGVIPRSFVAPAWGYSAGALAALEARRLPAWLPPHPGPLIDNGNGRETVGSPMEGLFRLDYAPFAALAEAGLPPSVVIHGALFDSRSDGIRSIRQSPTTLRLLLKRDLFRFPWVSGVRWIGAGELLDRLRGHDQIEVDGDRIENPAGFDLVVHDRRGRRSIEA